MGINLTRIYTKTGDGGTTNLSDFSSVSKNDSRLNGYADCDEANAAIGVAIAAMDDKLAQPSCCTDSEALPHDMWNEVRPLLIAVQSDLFDVGADISTPVVNNPKYPPLRITDEYVERLEGWCDQYNEQLEPLTSFILPGGSLLAAHLHVARTVTRRAERSVWAAISEHPDSTNVIAAKYLNRLSDLLFILCRYCNCADDVLWVPGANRA